MLLDQAIREVFHFLFLERLLKKIDPKNLALKGGVNLRFFFKSPRYSEDMDLDIRNVPVHVLREVGYHLLKDASLLRSLKVYGISELLLNDPKKAKHTETTQRFRLRLVTQEKEVFPTKIEFSRRGFKGDVELDTIDPEIGKQYQKLSYLCPHYSGVTAAIQKVNALAKRTVPQARDLFDLHILFLGGHFTKEEVCRWLSKKIRSEASENLLNFAFSDFRDQVLEYLREVDRAAFESPERWNRIQEEILDILTPKES